MAYDWEGPVDEKSEEYKQAVEFAKLYLIFELYPEAKKLLEYWEDVYARRRTSVNATINEYVANETMRAFLQKIREQLELARRG